MTQSSRPHVGEPLALDLLNTVWTSGDGPVDYLGDLHQLQVWLDTNAIEATATAAVRQHLVAARDAILAVLTNTDRAAIDAFNRVVVRGCARVRLDDERRAVHSTECDDPAWRPAVLAATNLVELLERHPTRIRRCEHSECVLWFLDTSRNGTRRWHSMATCGNREKAKRHYARTRDHAGGGP